MFWTIAKNSEVLPRYAGRIVAMCCVGEAMALRKFLDRELSCSMDGLEVTDSEFESISRYVDSILDSPDVLAAVAAVPRDVAHDENDATHLFVITGDA